MREEILKKMTGSPNRVDLEGMKINDHEIKEIIETIKKYKPTATIIDLDRNNITDTGAAILSEQLRDFEKITELRIQFNKIGREGAIHLFNLKKVFSDLDILFRGNQINDVGEMDDIEQLALLETPKLN